MKFQPDRPGANSITAYGPGWVRIGPNPKDVVTSSVVLTSEGLRQSWRPQRFEDLQPEDFALFKEMDLEVVLFGSGERLRFVHPGWLQPLMQQRIGFETMDAQAACRTFNILSEEGRKVALALLLESPPQGN